jgi:hypothetical protein
MWWVLDFFVLGGALLALVALVVFLEDKITK